MAICILCEQFKHTPALAGEPSHRRHEQLDAFVINCPRCGEYTADGLMVEDFTKGLPEAVGLALSGLARAGTKSGDHITIDYANYKALAQTAPVPTTYTGYIDRVLLDIARRCRYPGNETGQFPLRELAASVFLPTEPCSGLLGMLTAQGLVQMLQGDMLRTRLRLAPDGWARVDQLQSRMPMSHRAFVAMWFSSEVQSAYDDGIKPALLDCGYKVPFRVDDIEHEQRANEAEYNQKIDDRVLAEIRRSRFVVADVSGARNAVYYEAGFAEGLGIPVIWTCRATTCGADMCFDTQQIAHIIWEEPAQLRNLLATKLRARGWDLG